jgi:hypothetical protein
VALFGRFRRCGLAEGSTLVGMGLESSKTHDIPLCCFSSFLFFSFFLSFFFFFFFFWFFETGFLCIALAVLELSLLFLLPCLPLAVSELYPSRTTPITFLPPELSWSWYFITAIET